MATFSGRLYYRLLRGAFRCILWPLRRDCGRRRERAIGSPGIPLHRVEPMAPKKIIEADIAQLVPDDVNFNKGTQFGQSLIEKSLRQFGAGRSILLDKNNRIIAGNKTVENAGQIGLEKVLIVETTGEEIVAVKRTDIDLDTREGRELALADNATGAANLAWDEAALTQASDKWDIAPDDWGVELESYGGEGGQGEEDTEEQLRRLKDDFVMPPFSVLNTRTAEWQERRRAWLEIGIKSEEGRDDDLTFAKDAQPPIYWDTKNALREKLGREPSADEVLAEMEKQGIQAMTTTSIFDPVLTELSYRWFNIEGGRILDPFAGGSVRGIVAAKLNMPYVGNDLREKQVVANIENAKEVLGNMPADIAPRWTVGDSTQLEDVLQKNGITGDFDMVFSCPPYADLEVYSNDPRDISNMDYPQFLEAYKAAIKQACARLKNNRFAVFVVGDIRDKKGIYRNFIGHTIEAFTECGLSYYNHLILVNQVTSLAMRIRRQFNGGRKVGKLHQNVLVFCKGSVEETVDQFEEVQVTKAVEQFNKTRANSGLHDDVLVFYKGDPKAIKEEFGELHAGDDLPQ